MKIAFGVIVALAGSVASARIQDTSTAALTDGFGDRAQAAWTTSLEASQGFAVGQLDNQNGWAASGANTNWSNISTANPQNGTQHARFTQDTSVPQGTQRLQFTPTVPTAANTADTTSWWFYIDAAEFGGADYDFIAQAPSQAFLTWRINLSFLGGINILDDEGEGLIFAPSGTNYPVAQWFQLAVAADPPSPTVAWARSTTT